MKYIVLTLALLLSACSPVLQDGAFPRTHDYYDDLHTVYQAWQGHPDLPDVSTERCLQWLDNASIIHVTDEQEFITEHGMCPLTEDGCSNIGVCAQRDQCTTGTVVVGGMWGPRSKAIVIFLSPGESAEGHSWTVRHEGAHALALCAFNGMDSGHTIDAIWNAQTGIVAHPELYIDQ